MEIVNLLAEECKYYLNIEQTFWIDVIYTWRIDHDFDGSEIIAVHLRSVSIFGIDLPTWQLPKDIKNSIKQSIECRIARELLMVMP